MIDEETIYKSVIKLITHNRESNTNTKIMYRIKNVKGYYFAEEISTGAIFPTYTFYVASKEKKFNMNTNSYIKNGKYFIFCALSALKTGIAPYYFDKKAQEEIVETPSKDEINEYLSRSGYDFESQIKAYEAENEFLCDREIIKKAINEKKNSNRNGVEQDYKTKIDITQIKDFGFDLSTARHLCECIGRERELKETIKNIVIKDTSVLLIGEAGSGKTAIAESLALEIKRGTNKWLKNKTIISISANSLVADSKYRGVFEANMKKLIDFCKKHRGNVILFIDEIHSLKGLGSSEGQEHLDATNILKPYLSSRDVIIIGATTKREYQTLAQDDAFCRRFTKINIDILPRETVLEALKKYIKLLEEEYKVYFRYSEQETNIILNEILDVTDKSHQKLVGEPIVTNPTLSKNILEDAFVEAVYNEKEIVSIDDIYNALINCDKLSPTIRKEIAKKLKMILNHSLNEEKEPKPKGLVLDFPTLR